MAFEGLREQLREKFAELGSQIQESSAFNTLREKFEGQPAATQKVIIVGSIAFAALFLLSFPYGYISESSDNLMAFEENRELIRGLLKASRSANTATPLPPPQSAEMLKGTVRGMLRAQGVLEEQIGDMAAIPDRPSPGLAPDVVEQNGLAIQLRHLNLNQVIAIGTGFQNLGAGTKLMGMTIVQSLNKTHYYDMQARVVHFGLPPITTPEDNAPTKGNQRPRRPQPRGGGEDEL